MRYHHVQADKPMFTTDGTFVMKGSTYWMVIDENCSSTLSETAYAARIGVIPQLVGLSFDVCQGVWRMRLENGDWYIPRIGTADGGSSI